MSCKSNFSHSLIIALVCILLFLQPPNGLAQKPVFDSLEFVLTKNISETDRGKVLLRLSKGLVNADPKKAIDYGEQAQELYKAIDVKQLSNVYLTLTNAHQNLGDLEKVDEYIRLAETTATSMVDKTKIAGHKVSLYYDSDSLMHYILEFFSLALQYNVEDEIPNAYSMVAGINAMNGKFDSADSLWQIAIEHCTSPRFTTIKRGILYNLCVLNMQEAHYDKVLNYALEGYRLRNVSKGLSSDIAFLSVLAKVSARNLDTVQSIAYLEEAMGLIEKNKIYNQTSAQVVYGLGQYYLEHDSIEATLACGNLLMEISEKNGSIYDRARGNQLLAFASLASGIKDRALDLMNRSLKDTANMRGDKLKVDILMAATDLSFQLGRDKHMLTLLGQVESILQNNYNLHAASQMMEWYYRAYKRMGNEHQAFRALEEFKQLSDKYKEKTNNESLKRTKIEFDTERKQLQLEKSNIEVKLLSNKLIARRKQMILGISGLVLLFGFIYLFRSWKFTKSKSKLQSKFTQDLIQGQEDERKRIARDLHDGVGQNLILLKNQLADEPNKAEAVGTTLNEIRAVSRGLHPFVLERMGLSAAIENLIDEVDGQSDIFFDAEIDFVDAVIPKEKHLHIYRIIQEAVSNLIKYSESPSAQVLVTNRAKEVSFLVKDFGKGMTMNTTFASESLGMKTMSERATIINGVLLVDSNLGKGTTVELKLLK